MLTKIDSIYGHKLDESEKYLQVLTQNINVFALALRFAYCENKLFSVCRLLAKLSF